MKTETWSLIVSLGSLAVALVAVILAYEQARAYLYSCPRAYLDRQLGGLLVRNFGPGAMLDVRGTVELDEGDGRMQRIEFVTAGLVANQYYCLVKAAIIDELQPVYARIELEYASINGRQKKMVLLLGAADLSGLV